MRRTSSRFALIAVLLLLGTACASSVETGFPEPTPTEAEDDGHGGGGGDDGHGGGTTGGDNGGGSVALTGPVDVIDNAYEPKEATVKVGTTVVWEQSGSAPHNMKSAADDGALFDSHPECSAGNTTACMQKGDEFSFTFENAGEFLYYCVIHGTAQGLGMAGTITVEA